jgi:hypothetical protein
MNEKYWQQMDWLLHQRQEKTPFRYVHGKLPNREGLIASHLEPPHLLLSILHHINDQPSQMLWFIQAADPFKLIIHYQVRIINRSHPWSIDFWRAFQQVGYWLRKIIQDTTPQSANELPSHGQLRQPDGEDYTHKHQPRSDLPQLP